jgi:hypothetical protein
MLRNSEMRTALTRIEMADDESRGTIRFHGEIPPISKGSLEDIEQKTGKSRHSLDL